MRKKRVRLQAARIPLASETELHLPEADPTACNKDRRTGFARHTQSVPPAARSTGR